MSSGGAVGPLGELAASLDAERFVARTQLLDDVARAVSGRSLVRVVHLHGPAGVGKSAVLRAIVRQARSAGASASIIHGRAAPERPTGHAAAELDGALHDLIVVDDLDDDPALASLLFSSMGSRPASSVVVTASRRAPGGEWFTSGLDRITSVVALPPLDVLESRELLARSGLTDAAETDPIVVWACGYPAALTLAADLRSVSGRSLPPPGAPAMPGRHIDDLLVERLGDEAFLGVDPDVLDVAAVAPAVDAQLLAAVLPGRATRAGLTALRASRLSEPVGPRVALHQVIRTSRRRRLKAADPERYRDLVLAVADHLLARADTDGPRVLLELVSMIESPDASMGFEPSTTHYADIARAGDREALAAHPGIGGTAWFGRMARWIEERPEQVVMVRRANGDLSAAAIVYTHATLPHWAEDAIEVGPAVAHSRALGHSEATIFLQDVLIIEAPGDPAVVAEILRVGNTAALSLSGIQVPRVVVFTTPLGEGPDLTGFGYVEVPELRRADDERSLTTILGDFGPGGMVRQAYDVIRAEQRAPLVPPDDPSAWLVDVLRSFHDDAAVAESSGLDPAVARSTLLAALDSAFDASGVDETLRVALERTYLDPDGGHAAAQSELFMSRSSFYRHLQRARRQLVERGTSGP